jgi:hypothetical protein
VENAEKTGKLRKEECRKGKQRNQEYRIRKTSKMKFFSAINSYGKKKDNRGRHGKLKKNLSHFFLYAN